MRIKNYRDRVRAGFVQRKLVHAGSILRMAANEAGLAEDQELKGLGDLISRTEPDIDALIAIAKDLTD